MDEYSRKEKYFMDMDYIALCKNFYSATKIPVTLIKNNHAVYSSLNDIIGSTPTYYRDLFPMGQNNNPSFCGDSPDIEYGRILVEGTEYNLILGPVFSVPLTDAIIRQAAKEAAVPLENREQYVELLYAIPRLSQMQFAHYLLFLYQCLNHRPGDLSRLLSEDDSITKTRKEHQTDRMVEVRKKKTFTTAIILSWNCTSALEKEM